MTITPVNDIVTYTTYEGFTWAAPMVVTIPPAVLMTDSPDGVPRLRVDVGQTGFFAGREFRTFRRLDVSSGNPLVIRAVVPVNVILFQLSLELVDGWIDVETVVGGTAGGTWGETLPIFNRNNMAGTPAYSHQAVLTAGGTHTGGTVLDALAARAAGSTAQASSVGSALSDERGIAPGTYYFRLTQQGSGNAVGILHAYWEERP